jgi:hypothetical protein
MSTLLTYSEIATGIVGLCLVLIAFLFSIRLLIKTAGKLKKIAIYFLIGCILAAGYIIGRLINLEVLLPEGKLINLILVLFISLLVLMIILNLNKIVNEIIGKGRSKTESKPKKEIKFENNQSGKKPIITFAGDIGNRYLDLTGRKPKFRE